MDRKARLNLLYITLALIGVYVAQGFLGRTAAVADIPYSQFQTLLKSGQVTAVRVAQDHLEGELKAPLDGKSSFVTTRVEPGFAKDLDAAGVAYSGVAQSNPVFFSTYVFLFSLLVGGVAWYFMGKRLTRSASAGMMAIGKSKAKVYVETDTKTSFADVAGVDEAKEELKEIVNFLKDPKAFGRLGARMPKGVLLVGPPGTGKTLLAKAVAGEAGVPFYAISGSEFVEMFVGVGAARVRDLFEQARKTAPAIIFIDELDALGRARGAAGPMGGGHDEKEQTLNQLLVELDGFDGGSGLVLLAATNRPEVLDPALLRAGRFDRQVLVDRPDRAGRVQILQVHARKVQLDPDVKLDEVAALTPGFTGADLANLLNEAALVATRRQAERIAMPDFNAAIERIIAGLEKKNRLLNAREREIVAHHELGHALVAAALPGTDVVHKISIIPRGIGALGYTIQRPTEDRFLMTREELLNKMAVLMGGRAAEQVVFNHLSTGASDDLARATDIARSMVTRFGMGGEGLGPVTYETEPQSFLGQAVGSRRDYAEDTAQAIDTAIRGLVEEAFQRARRLLIRNRELLSDGARELLTRETLAGDELGTLLGRVRAEEPLAA